MNFHTVIGLEMHCEMKSTTKVFSPAINNYSPSANINISPIDLGFPGILPTVNEECIKKAIKAALILNCQIPKYMLFDRKNYYYPDLPKGYQITQNTSPVGTNGHIDVEVGDHIINVEISDIHLEEDSASLDHMSNFSLIDYNRAGVPLLECVTSPCLHSADEAVAFIDTMCNIYRYTDISDADTRRGQIRCDVNISLQGEDGTYLTPKIEVKNVNSLGNVRATILYEEKRLQKALENNEANTLEQETRRFDEETGTTIHMRSKADAIDYKYFVEPNIPPYSLNKEYIDDIKKDIPRLALERKLDYINNYGLDVKSANIIVKNRDVADYFEKCISLNMDIKLAANYINGLIASFISRENISINDLYLKPEGLLAIIKKQNEGIISSKQAKEIITKVIEDKVDVNNLLSEVNAQLSDTSELEAIIDNIIANNSQQVDEYHNGHTNLFDYFVGQVMKVTKGGANPVITKELLNKKLNQE